MSKRNQETYDLFVIGGGVNGCGIARDAAGRGLSVALAEMNDLASGTSSASTKLFHGGLRYLEYFEVGLVGKALREREVLLRAMPHISWPMRFVLPVHKDMRFDNETPVSRLLGIVMPWMKGRRPAWLIRLGLFLYDHMGGRKILAGTRVLDLRSDPVGEALQDKFVKAFEYSDCWVEDARLVALNARDAEERGAKIMTRCKVVSAARVREFWEITLADKRVIRARALVNASGPWVEDIIRETVQAPPMSKDGVRLVRGSHIVTEKLFDHDKSYFFQGEDGRIIFAIPYETDFTLIGTTDADHGDADTVPVCTDAEADYLREFASGYFKVPIAAEDIVWSYSGVRSLYDDGAASAAATTRDYVLSLDNRAAPLLSVFGGKITTYRRLAEAAMAKFSPYFSTMGGDWTAGVALPGGNFPVDGVAALIADLHREFGFLNTFWAQRLIKAYGTDAWEILRDAVSADDLGRNFGGSLTEREVNWLIDKEYAQTAEDIVWRRSKLGLRMSDAEIAALDVWMQEALAAQVS